MTIYTEQSANVRRTWMLMTSFLVLVVALGFAFSYVFDNALIFWGALIFSLVMNIGSYWYSDKIVLSMSGARQIAKEDNPELWNIVENLSITAGIPMPRLFIVEDPSPNAFATGRDKEHAAVAVHTGILRILNRSELEGVLAHELSHIGNRDILVATIAVVLAGFVSLLSDLFMRSMLWGGSRSDNDRAGAFGLILGVLLAILAPIFATLIQLAVSRKREYLADASGALLTRYPEGLASALEKISGVGISSTSARTATAHLYIANPFNGRKIGGVVANLFATHPPIEERIALLRAMDIDRSE